MIKWKDNKVKNIWVAKGPYPTPQGLVKKQLTDWVFWVVETKKTKQIDLDRALFAIPDPSNTDGICQFWMDYGPIAAGYVPKLCRGCVEKANDVLKPLSLEIKGAPLEAVQKAVGLLYLLVIKHAFRLADQRKLDEMMRCLALSFHAMSEKWRQYAKPIKHMYLYFDNNELKPTSIPELWWRNYCVRVPVREDELLDWNNYGFRPFRDIGKVSFTDISHSNDGYITVTVDYLFPLLLNYYCEDKHQPEPCACGCGQLAKPGSEYAHPSHRKRVWWKNNNRVLKLWKEEKSIKDIAKETGIDIEKIERWTKKAPRS